MGILAIIPNVITFIRILGGVALLFIKPLTIAFYVVYTISGLSDALDGFLARKLKVTSDFGSKLDSIADLLFYAVVLLRLFPKLWDALPGSIWYGVTVVFIIRFISYGVVAVKYHRFSSQHTYMNKLTGLSVFIVPYAMGGRMELSACVMVVVIALISSLEELLIHLKMKEYDGTVKSLFAKKIRSI